MKALALALCVALAATGARANEPIYDAQEKAPEVYGPLVWRFGGVDAHGFFYTDAQVQKIDLRIKYLEDKAAKECVTATNEANKKLLGAAPSTWILAGAALIVGIAGGYYVGKKL